MRVQIGAVREMFEEVNMRSRRGAGVAFLAIGIAFAAVAISGQRAFVGVGVVFLVLGIAFLARRRTP